MDKQPSGIKIIIIDYTAFAAFLFSFIPWGVYIFLVMLKEIDFTNITLPLIFGVITIAGIGVVIWRVLLIHIIYNDGQEVLATISNKYFFRDRGRIDYTYTYQGQKYISGNAVHKVKQTQALQIGDQVSVVVDRNKPKRAFIRSLYI